MSKNLLLNAAMWNLIMSYVRVNHVYNRKNPWLKLITQAYIELSPINMKPKNLI